MKACVETHLEIAAAAQLSTPCSNMTQMKLSLVLLCAATMLAVANAAPAGRTVASFDYNWKFKLGDPTTAIPALHTASRDPTFSNLTGYTCTQLAWSQLGRMGTADCTGACSATPGCLAWQYNPAPSGQGSHRGCFIHDGTLGAAPVCTKQPNIDPEAGPAVVGYRKVVPPPVANRSGVAWKEKAFVDSAWSFVDVPHDVSSWCWWCWWCWCWCCWCWC